MNKSQFFKQTELMLRTIPFVAQEKCFALKGGTAINFFIRNLPRLSVDIDLTYLPIQTRENSLKSISDSLKNISTSITKTIPSFKIQELQDSKTHHIVKLLMTSENETIKIVPNTVLRGSALPTENRKVVKAVEKLFNLSVSTNVLSEAELYGGKLCAALDRQHPRDLFDIKILFENGGITDAIRECFVVYLASHDRPISELINPNRKNIKGTFENYFEGMTTEAVTLTELIDVREKMIKILQKELTDSERKFLISVKEGQPDWHLIPLAGIDKLPGIQWKLMNIGKMSKKKHEDTMEKLRIKLGL